MEKSKERVHGGTFKVYAPSQILAYGTLKSGQSKARKLTRACSFVRIRGLRAYPFKSPTVNTLGSFLLSLVVTTDHF